MLCVVGFVLIQGLYIILWILGSTDLGMTDEFTCGYHQSYLESIACKSDKF